MPFICWYGSKKILLDRINRIIDKYLDDETIYIKPFLGSGIVLINVLKNYSTRFKRYICCDLNEALITSFKQIKGDHQNLIRILEHIQSCYSILEMDNRRPSSIKPETFSTILGSRDLLTRLSLMRLPRRMKMI